MLSTYNHILQFYECDFVSPELLLLGSFKTFPRAVLAALLALAGAITLAVYFPDFFTSSTTIGNQASQTARRSISMAWRSSGASNEALIENLASNGLIRSDKVKKAMLGVCHHENA